MHRVVELDGLRAIAVVLVMVFHTTNMGFAGGWIGVDIFFVLSGYLITSLLTLEFERSHTIGLRKFYIRRVLRLFPALAVLLVLYAVAVLPFTTDFARQAWAIVAAALYAMNWVRAFEINAEGHIGHTWSLAVEEQFYFFWPIILIFALRRGGRSLAFKVALGLLLASAAWRAALVHLGAPPVRTYTGFDTRADALFVGCAIALVPLSPRLVDAASRFVVLPIAAIAAVSLLVPWNADWVHLGGLTLFALVAAWLLIACLGSPPGFFFEALRSAPFQYIGRISYGVYLWHALISSLLGNHYGFKPMYVSLIVPPVTLIMASASYFLVEKPFLQLKDKFEPAAKSIATTTYATTDGNPESQPI